MKALIAPDPVIDAREQDLLDALTRDYVKFTSPGLISKGASAVGQGIVKITPRRLRKFATDAVDMAGEWEYIKLALEHAGKGFVELTKHASRFTLSHDKVVASLNSAGYPITHFDHICTARSYHLEQHLSKRNYGDLGAAFAEGAATGAPGLLGVPFNIALSFLLYFRAVQSTALFYGYDIKGDPRELEFASEATIASLAPNSDSGANTLGGLIGKMMFATNATVLRQALSKKTYTEMAKRGGAELLYVQIRALANKAAEKALRNAGQEGLEAGVFKKLLEQIGQRLPKEAGKKAIPLLGAVVGALSDTYYMSRVLRGSNLIYHKRFLFEKEHRVGILCDTDMNS
jgi:hypothetical protein